MTHAMTHAIPRAIPHAIRRAQATLTHARTMPPFLPRTAPAFAAATAAAAAAALLPAGVHAQTADAADPTEPQSKYVLGASLSVAPEYPGASRQTTKLRPLWAYQYGRWRISTSRASSVLGFASDAAGPGASAELVSGPNWRVGAALRFDSGRSSSDSPDLEGMPDVKRTLRGRLYASYRLAPQWSLGGSLSQDLIGRRGGLIASLDLGHSVRLGPRTEISSGAGISFGSAQYMNTYFGVPDSAARPDRPAFAPGAGARDVHLGVGVMTALAPRWIAFANVGASRLLQDAAASPLTRNANGASVSFGLAYRCCN